MHIGSWFERLAGADGEPRDRLLAALDVLGPDTGTVFTPLPGESALVESGVLARPMAELEAAWRTAIRPVFERYHVPLPPPTADPANGRTTHGTDFEWLHGEFTSVRRSDPAATW
jgi:1,2-phenylacetyl-CoA epoxidase catalytic subunit